ncbi:MAG: dTDP-4-dehydrorhamnose 3,5-epimerase [Proteobacteria bacterium]|nr:dTDP-4-dehydrorhamnose 3,5-epimerase [Pseudomonadota bacterium]
MKVRPSAIADVIIVEPDVYDDARGFFTETWNAGSFSAAGLELHFVQCNHSHSTRGVLRGLHYQAPAPQGKLVRAITGEIFDVAVDLRRPSPTFGQWVGMTISAANKHSVWIPPGFAHGFYVLSASADVVYLCTGPRVAASEQTLRWDDAELAIAWPLLAAPIVSEKDARGVSLADAVVYHEARPD